MPQTPIMACVTGLHSAASKALKQRHWAWACCNVWAALSQDVDGKMQQELDSNVSQCMLDIQSVIAPIQQLTAAEQQRLETALSRLEGLRLSIENLKQRAANVE